VQAVLSNQDRCLTFGENFVAYADLWTQDMDATLTKWLADHTTHNEGLPLCQHTCHVESIVAY
jgi:hypothetical protein